MRDETMNKVVYGKYHQHVDNGGLTMEVSKEGDNIPTLKISEGYHGYSQHTYEFAMMTPDHLEKFGQALIIAAAKLREEPNE